MAEDAAAASSSTIPPPGDATAIGEVVFGSAAGMTAKLFEHPFDLIKVRLQSQPTDRPAAFTGPLDCFKQTFAKEGWKGLYRGLSAPIFGAACENATLFLCYAKCQEAIISLNPKPRSLSEKALGKRRALSTPELALAGAGAGAVTSFVLTPIELVKCRMQVQMLAREGAIMPPAAPIAGSSSTSTRSFHSAASTLNRPSGSAPPIFKPQGPFEIISSTIKSHGVRGLWLGQMGTFFRETGGSAAWFTAYELSTKYFVAQRQKALGTTAIPVQKGDLPMWQLMLSGCLAGISYNVILFPADSIKSSMQTWSELNPDKPRLGFGGMAKKIWRTRGIKGMYAGLGITCLRSGPSSSMIFFIYETLSAKYGHIFG